jgi:hypothetical protein
MSNMSKHRTIKINEGQYRKALISFNCRLYNPIIRLDQIVYTHRINNSTNNFNANHRTMDFIQ